ncbi:MAG TPA: two-component sensor histidine kinase, partial [Lachnospiraceae bacterium]|nr:two-component sensor histidine kinase [Lachnospiraceae bacterium]
RENVSLAVLLASVIQDLSVCAELNGTELEMNVPDSVSVITDFKWTKEALSNIIRNAIEHTPGGTVRIRASQSVVAVDLDICDNGCGISAGDLPHIFERFYKGKQASPDSAGIGLSLAKEVIQKQNGSIEASGAEGEGTAFHIRFFQTGTL